MSEQTIGKKISLEQARSYIKNYSDEAGLPEIKTVSMLIEKKHIESVISQDGCEYLRFYMAKTVSDKSGQYTLVIVGTDEKENDMITGNEIYQDLMLCPPFCNGGGIISE